MQVQEVPVTPTPYTQQTPALTSSLESIASFATLIGHDDASKVLRQLPLDVANHFVTLFIKGATSNDFEPLKNAVKQLPIPDMSMLLLITMISSNKVKRIKQDNSKFIEKLERETEAIRQETEAKLAQAQQKMNLQLQKAKESGDSQIASKKSDVTYEQEKLHQQQQQRQRLNELENEKLKIEKEMLKTEQQSAINKAKMASQMFAEFVNAQTVVHTPGDVEMFSDVELRDLLIEDPVLKMKAIQLGLMVEVDGVWKWK